MNRISTTVLAFATLAITGCGIHGPSGNGDIIHSRAQAPLPTDTHQDLTNLPKPLGKITAAVYEFRDKTGQYRQSPSNGLSTTVTQGADSILIKALLDSNWFIPVERASLQNVLTERKISLSESTENEAPQISVKPAEVIFQGTVVSYDSNTHTGGYGARLLGLGAFQTFREDRVTVNLRVIDSDDGLVLHSITSSKRIFSREISANLFSYVDEDKILELEAGTTYNEPSHVAITEAIESALIHVIGEGVLKASWSLQDNTELKDPVFDRFMPVADRNAFVETHLARIEKYEEQKALHNKVKVRVLKGRAALKKHWEDNEQERNKRLRAYARKRYQRLQQEQLAKIEHSETELVPSQGDARVAETQQTSVTDNNRATAAPKIKTAEAAIAEQAQAILNAQAQIQIQATQQAHRAALYAQKLILQQQQAAAEAGASTERPRQPNNTPTSTQNNSGNGAITPSGGNRDSAAQSAVPVGSN